MPMLYVVYIFSLEMFFQSLSVQQQQIHPFNFSPFIICSNSCGFMYLFYANFV